MTTAETAPVDLSFTDAELKLLRQKYAKLTDVEFEAFLAAAHRYRLNPLANQIYARLQEQTQKNPRNVTYMTQIDGYRLMADRTGLYAGNEDPVFDNENQPTKATVTVSKIVEGQVCKFTASARMKQYRPAGNAGFMWDRMPHLMLGKCAEALALRKAFPAELAGLYTVEEMEQADTHDAAPANAKQETKTEKPKNDKPDGDGKPDWSALKNFPIEKILPLIAVADTYVLLEKMVDGCEDGDAWLDLGEREQILSAIKAKYKELISKKVRLGDWNQDVFNQKMKNHFTKLDLDKQGDELWNKKAAAAAENDPT